MEVGEAPAARRATAIPGRIGGILIALGGAVLLLSFLLLDVVDYSFTSEYVSPGETIDVQYKGTAIVDETSGDGSSLLVWTVGAASIAIIAGLLSLIPAVAKRFWIVAIPVAVAAAGWVIFAARWYDEEIDTLSRTGAGGKISLAAGVAIFVIAVLTAPVTAIRNRGAVG